MYYPSIIVTTQRNSFYSVQLQCSLASIEAEVTALSEILVVIRFVHRMILKENYNFFKPKV